MNVATDNAAVCTTLVREHDFPRYAATLFAPPGRRAALLALAAFDLEILRIPDQVSQPLPGEVRLQWWVDLLEGTEHGGVAGHPIAAELLGAVRSMGLPAEPFLRAIRAHTFDLYNDPMPNSAALDIYLDDTAGEFLSAQLRVLGGMPAAHESLIRDAGRALGLTRIVARMAHDAARRRCFLPSELMREHGLAIEGYFARNDTPALRAVRGALIASARRHLANAEIWEDAEAALRPAFLPLATLSRELDTLACQPPFALHVPPSRLRVLWSQWRAQR